MHLGKLFCECCREEVGTKKSVVDGHVTAAKHITALQKMAKMQGRSQPLLDRYFDYLKANDLEGDNVKDSSALYRLQVLDAMLRTGVPLVKVDGLRSILEHHGLRLTHSSHLRRK